MYDKDEKSQIKKASLLADTQPAEKLDTVRARSFVTSVMKSGRQSHLLAFSISASAILAVVAIVAVVIISRPEADNFGTPATLYEEAYVHASTANADSTLCMQSDSLTVKRDAQE